MFKEPFYILICFLLAFLVGRAFLLMLEEDYGIEIELGKVTFISQTGGEEWVELKKLRKVGGAEKIVFDVQNPNIIYMASVKRIFESFNKGESFQKKFQKEKIKNLQKLIAHPTHSNIFFAIFSEGIRRNKLSISFDGGESFETIFTSQKDNKITAFSPDPALPQVLYLGTENGDFLRSEDFGKSWKKTFNFSRKIGKIIPNPHIFGEIFVWLSPKGRDLFNYLSFPLPAKVMVSENGGEDFLPLEKKFSFFKKFPSSVSYFVFGPPGQKPASPFEIKDIVFSPKEDEIYFVSKSKIIKIKDKKGEILNLPFTPDDQKITAFTIDPKNPNILYLGAEESFFKSEDGGETWECIELPQKGKVVQVKINPNDPEMILVSIEKTF